MPDLRDCEEGWYCLLTLPKKEGLAARHLEAEYELPAFAPIVRFRKNTRRGPVWFQEAMFPGYLFVHCTPAEHYRRLLACRGVRGMVTYGDYVPLVPAGFIDLVRAQLEAARAAAEEDPFEPGQSVTIADGAFKQWEAVILGRVPGKERVRILLEFLGREVTLDLAPSSLILPGSPLDRVRKGK
ncbi:MAG: hypothetical protein JJT96_19615 [Opitutales bacterium]|nr:hypothetical protein [Opitutales bacterium]